MWDPFSYEGPKSHQRLEDERYVRALQMRDTQMNMREIAEALGLQYETMRWRISLIDKEMERA